MALAVVLTVLIAIVGVVTVAMVLVIDRREQREHDAAPPNNRVVGSVDQLHNRVFD